MTRERSTRPAAYLEPRTVECDLAAYYDQEADDRAQRPLDDERVASRARFAASLQPGSAVLEIGTGAGRDAGYFVDAGMFVSGIDLSLEQSRHAASRGCASSLASVRALPFPSRTFAAVWSMSVLMHVPEVAIEGALREIGRVLRTGGRAAIGVWGGEDVEEHAPDDRYEPYRLFSRRSDDRWRGLLGIIGTVDEFRTWGTGSDAFWYQWAVVRAG